MLVRKRRIYRGSSSSANGGPLTCPLRQTRPVRPLVALALLAALAVPAAHARATRAPALRLVDTAPVVLRGTGFAGLERVTVALTRNGRSTIRRVRATRRGSFTVGFGLLALEPCRGAIVVRATGGRGSRAVLRRECRAPSR